MAKKAGRAVYTPFNLNALRGNDRPTRRGTVGRFVLIGSGKTYTPNSERECARRRRQIAAGILKVSA